MRRLIAILLGLTVASGWSQASALHVHAYGDHDHPEHGHGLTADHHHGIDSHSDDARVHLESCDPDRHVVSIAVACVASQLTQAFAGECVVSWMAVARLTSHHVIDQQEVRVHGPPSLEHAPSRAPPLTFRA